MLVEKKAVATIVEIVNAAVVTGMSIDELSVAGQERVLSKTKVS